MPLSGNIVRQLRQAIVAAFNAPDLIILVREQLNQDLDAIVGLNGSDQNYVTFQLLAWAEKHDRILPLVDAISNERPTNPQIQAVVALVRTSLTTGAPQQVVTVATQNPAAPVTGAPPADPNYPEALFVGRRPFINRLGLKAALEEMIDPAVGMRRGIIINGGEGTGKTFSWQRFRQRDKMAIYAIVSIAEWSETACGPDDICGSIAEQLNLDMSELQPDPHATPARRAMQLKSWLYKKLKGREEPIWIFIDGLLHPCIAPGSREFALHILNLASDGRLPKLRVALAECGSLDQGLLGQVFADSLTGLTRADVAAHVKEVIGTLGSTLPDPIANAFADKIFEGLPDPLGHQGMAELVRRYSSLYPKLLASGANAAAAGGNP